MTVGELILVLQGCDLRAIVLIPTSSPCGERCEPVVEAASIAACHFAHGAGAKNGAVRLCSFPAVLMSADPGMT